MTEYEILSQDVCYECKKICSDLITPCGNIECKARFHKKCLKEQILEGKNKCDKCDKPIIITKIHKFKLGIYCNKILMILMTLSLFIICATTSGLLIFGTSVSDTGEEDMKSAWIIGKAFTIPIAGTISLIIICYFCAGFYTEEFNKKYYIKIMEFTGIENKDYNQQHLIITCFLLFIVHSVILICHFFGFLILKFLFSMGNLFNYKTFDTGLIFVTLCVIISLIIFSIMFCCQRLYLSSVQEKTVFGSRVGTEET